jgi:hypothetical protein
MTKFAVNRSSRSRDPEGPPPLAAELALGGALIVLDAMRLAWLQTQLGSVRRGRIGSVPRQRTAPATRERLRREAERRAVVA